MAKNKNNGAPVVTGSGQFNPALKSPAGRAWLESKLAEAKSELRYGPGNTGWQDNESKRPLIEERVAFLEALIALLPD